MINAIHYKNTLLSKYIAHCMNPSDINEHLPTLNHYSRGCSHITECGVRSAVSSYAFAVALKGKPSNKLVQVDPVYSSNISVFQTECRNENVNTIFHAASDLDCPIETTELLFIDTWHVYGQLKRELSRWHNSVLKYIILHDTTVDGFYGETIRNGWDAVKQSAETGIPVDEINRGLGPAVSEFIAEHPEWTIEAVYTNNNGLTVLRRLC